jgi:LAO/AO transport system kinase
MKIVDALLKGDTRALARAISLIENRHPDRQKMMRIVFPHTGRAAVVGVTGSPGSGKSTLVDGLILRIKDTYKSLGIVAVDPSSPFTGGAMLADRIRMMQHSRDPDVFIRSMATRGHLGGLSAATGEAVALLEAAGKDLVLVETVGVGQDEVEVVKLAELILVLLTPDAGDDVQVFKAGLMEIADIFVLNKSDSPETAAVERRLSALLDTGLKGTSRPPVLRTTATTGEGLDDLWSEIRARLAAATEEQRRARRKRRLGWILKNILREKLAEQLADVLNDSSFENLIDRIYKHETDPYTLAEELLKNSGEVGNGDH